MVKLRMNTLEIDIQSEVQSITSETSEKFVAEPSKADALSDLIIGLKRYKNTIRWKEYFMNNPCNDSTNYNDKINKVNKSESTKDKLKTSISASLGNKLKPTNKSKNAPPGSSTLEAYILVW